MTLLNKRDPRTGAASGIYAMFNRLVKLAKYKLSKLPLYPGHRWP